MTDERVSRRQLLRTALLGSSGLLAAYAVGCGGDGSGPTATGAATASMSPEPSSPTPAPSPTAARPSALAWRQLTSESAPPARRDHSLVTDGQHLYLFGGRSGAGTLGDTWTYNIATNAWRQLDANGPVPRFGHNSVWDASRGQMAVFGGQNGAFFNDAWEFEPAAKRWTQLAAGGAGPEQRYGAAAALDPAGHLLISHGFTDAGRYDDTWSLGLPPQLGWTDLSPAGDRPIKRCLVRGAWDEERKRFLIFGGQTNANPFLGDLWMLKQGAWTELASEPKPSPRNLYAMALDQEGQRVIVAGGRSEQGQENDVWFLDLASDTWTQAQPAGEAFPARFGHDAAWLAERRTLLVFGGNDNSSDLNDLWELSVPL